MILKDLHDVCPECGGCGYLLSQNDTGELIAEPCKCMIKKIDRNRLRFANIPEMFCENRLKTFNVGVYREEASKKKISAACRIIKIYMDNFAEMKRSGMGLYMYSGTKGSGKTRMAASIANELLDKGEQVKFATSTAILKEIKQTWNPEYGYSESSLLDQLSLTAILIIDDFGTERPAPWMNDKFYHIINERYVGKRVTIFTSNESLETLEYDERIKSRMKENTYQIGFPEESVRERLAEKNRQEILARMG